MNIVSQTGPNRLHLSWQEPQGLAGLSFVNAILTVLTLGIYSFWAKTEVRKKLWSAIRLNGEPLSYTGSGKQLLLGFVASIGLVLLPLFIISTTLAVWSGPNSLVSVIVQIIFYVAALFLWGFASWRAYRYRIANTTWRGIRGSLQGSGQSYTLMFFFSGLLIPLTLGWIIPWRSTRLRSLLVNDARFGNGSFQFNADSRPLYQAFAIFWVLGSLLVALCFLLTVGLMAPRLGPELDPLQGAGQTRAWASLGIYLTGYLIYLILSSWYRARQDNYFASQTRFDGARLRGTQSGTGRMWASTKAYFITIFSLGLLTPIAQSILWRYWTENLQVEGTVDLDKVAQGALVRLSRGEGLAQAFDFDV